MSIRLDKNYYVFMLFNNSTIISQQKLVNSRKSSNNQEVSVLFLKSFSFLAVRKRSRNIFPNSSLFFTPLK